MTVAHRKSRADTSPPGNSADIEPLDSKSAADMPKWDVSPLKHGGTKAT
jgi:hypothetical protein